jgi:hypothetical protein
MPGQFRCAFRALILPGCLVAFNCLASADVFNVNGTFDDIYGGPLNGGSFVGTFTATLPITTAAIRSQCTASTCALLPIPCLPR